MSYSKEECLGELERVSDELGKSPTVQEFAEAKTKLSYATIQHHCGSWNEAKKELGLETYSDREQASKEWLQSLKDEMGCSRCGEDHNECLDFHHMEKEDKRDAVSSMSQKDYSKKVVLDEISKCVVLCSNCHRKHHSDNHGFDADERYVR